MTTGEPLHEMPAQSGAIRSALQSTWPSGQESVEITTKAGIVITVYVSPQGRSVQVFKRKQGKRAHELKVVDG